jgi:hypothetical protein
MCESLTAWPRWVTMRVGPVLGHSATGTETQAHSWPVEAVQVQSTILPTGGSAGTVAASNYHA